MLATQQWVREYFPQHTCTTAHQELRREIVDLRVLVLELQQTIRRLISDVKAANCDHCFCQKVPWLVESFGTKQFTMTSCCRCSKEKLSMKPWKDK